MTEFLQTAAKAVAAGLVALIGIINQVFGLGIGPLDEGTVNSILLAVITLLVYFVPNKQPSEN